MAGQITGKFLADFTSFNNAVDSAVTHLKGMETSASSVQTRLNTMVDQFSGRKIIQEAELMGKTFELLAEKGIGLTTKELQRMGVVAEEAMAKLKAGGEPIPAGIQKIADAANKVKPALDGATSSASGLFATLKSAASAFGIAFSVQALTRFVGSVLEAGSAIGDLSQQLGISAEAVQRFKYAAEQGGSSLDAVGTAIQFMNKTLGAGENSTKQLLKDAGLAFQDIRGMKPEDAFLAISDAIAGIEDPMAQATLVTKLFGRSAAELLPAIQDGIKKVGDQTTVMGDDTVAQLKRAEDAWGKLGNWVTVVSGGIIADTIGAIEAMTKSWDDFFTFIANATVLGKGVGGAVKIAQQEAREIAFWENAQRELNRELGVTTVRLGETKTATDAAAEAAKKLKTEWDAYITAALKRGDEVIKFLKNYDKAMVTVDETMGKFVTGHLKDLGDRGQRILSLTSDAVVKLGLDMAGLHPVVEGLGDAFIKALDPKTFKVRELPPEIKKVKFDIDDLSKALSQMATVAGGTFGAMASGFATLVTGANAARTAIQQIKDASKATDKFEGILGMSTGIMGIVTAALAAVNAIKGIWGAINQREGRHTVEDFADSFGGFDALHAKLLELGDAGEQLWIKLTQGVPAGNADAAARVIAEIEAALASQKTAVDEVTEATEEQAQATIETASQAAKALEELGPKIDINKDEWKSWGDLVTAQIQRIADGLRAMPMPSAMAIAGGNGGIHGGMGPIMNGDVVVRSNLYIDGYVAAESVSRQVVG